ncbi:MAG: hypothetical protein JW763_06330 [candidate division Zixibacteria bacterium]|nr:hypothetical protein [candidate division Zixibacteria bacterium]
MNIFLTIILVFLLPAVLAAKLFLQPLVDNVRIVTGTIAMYNNLNQAVPNAMVYVTATDPTGGTYTAVTGSDGTDDFQISGVKKPSDEWCFEETDISHATMTYSPADNNVISACESGRVYGDGGDMLALTTPQGSSLTNRPNSFNPATMIEMYLPDATDWSITIFNIAGRKVAEIAGTGRQRRATTNWNADGYASGYISTGRRSGVSCNMKAIIN